MKDGVKRIRMLGRMSIRGINKRSENLKKEKAAGFSRTKDSCHFPPTIYVFDAPYST